VTGRARGITEFRPTSSFKPNIFFQAMEYRTMHVTEVTREPSHRSDFARLERTLRVSIRLMQRSQREIRRKRTKEECGEEPARGEQGAAR
jgi:hypothetical protein